MKKERNYFSLLLGTLFLWHAPQTSLAEERPIVAVQNPISPFITVPFKTTFDQGATNGSATTLNIQPVFSISLNDEWNLFNRAVIPIARADGAIVGPGNPSPKSSGSANGLGDISYALLFSPVHYEKFLWGIGPTISMKTASSDQLGSGKWSTGIAGMVLTDTGWGNLLLRARQIWSFAGDADRKDVSQMLIEPIVTYRLNDGWHLFSDMIISANWKVDSSNRWIVPLGGGFGRKFKFGDQRILSRIEAYYNVERPEGAPDYSVSFTVQFVFPR